jgi:hypothetical protein
MQAGPNTKVLITEETKEKIGGLAVPERDFL